MIDAVLSHTSVKHDWFVESRSSKTNEKADWYVWADARADGSPPNNWLSMFGGSAWQWDPVRMQYYMHNFLSSQPDLNFHCLAVQDRILSELAFWLERGVDGFRLDTVNFYFHSKGLESNPAIDVHDMNESIAPSVNPYNFQDHIYDKSQPENVVFTAKIRALMDKYPGSVLLGEIGDAQRQIKLLSDYTSGNSHLHMAYIFDFLGGQFSSAHFQKSISELPKGAWVCNAFSNHDVMRHVSRWGSALVGKDRENLARVCIMLLLCLRGSVCLYQGEELGLGEADLSYEDLVDPYGIEFWPRFKGRDGCRTPIPWCDSAPLAGFSRGPKSWLPVVSDHLGRSVNLQEGREDSVLWFYRRALAFRKQYPELVGGEIALHPGCTEAVLAFYRDRLLCVFNMTNAPATLAHPRAFSKAGLAPCDGLPANCEVQMEGKKMTLPAFGWQVLASDVE